MKIGKIKLDTTWYPGRDLYSDGEIEDTLLNFARTVPAGDRSRAILEAESWPVLYHFSHLRGNILGWYPFTGKEKVLEIGAGCGAVTELLCERVASVTALELSLKRSTINASRQPHRENLQILVGNFEDIEPHLARDYDVITLIGVYEYAGSYIHAADPYETFLKKVMSHLSDDGRLLLAIENRLGLKYFAGCTEDHSGRLFDGLECYPGGGHARTFSRVEWENLLLRAGGLQAQWYYPWPDYKFPVTIFSDSRLPEKGELAGMEENYDRLRLKLFDETAVSDTLTAEGLFPTFSNSFFLVITRTGAKVPVVYSRFSNERADTYCVRTDLVDFMEPEKHPRVFKTALSSDPAHVESLIWKTDSLKEQYAGSGFSVNEIQRTTNPFSGVRLGASHETTTATGIVELAYVSGITLESLLDEILLREGPDAAGRYLLNYADRIRQVTSKEPFRKTKAFTEVFGSLLSENAWLCAPVTNIDLLTRNILPNVTYGGKQYAPFEASFDEGKRKLEMLDTDLVTDVEWTFDFPIPADYVVWRYLHYYLEGSSRRQSMKNLDLFAAAGLRQEDLTVFASMEKNFQSYMLQEHVPLRLMYRQISPGQADAVAWFCQILHSGAPRQLQVFVDLGQGFNPAHVFSQPLERTNRITWPVGTRSLRLDPGEAPGGFEILELKWSDGREAEYETNGFPLRENVYYYGAGDPQLVLPQIPPDAGELILKLRPLKEQEASAAFWQAYGQEETRRLARLQDMKNRLFLAEEKIRQMEQTKIWRLYRKIKPL